MPCPPSSPNCVCKSRAPHLCAVPTVLFTCTCGVEPYQISDQTPHTPTITSRAHVTTNVISGLMAVPHRAILQLHFHSTPSLDAHKYTSSSSQTLNAHAERVFSMRSFAQGMTTPEPRQAPLRIGQSLDITKPKKPRVLVPFIACCRKVLNETNKETFHRPLDDHPAETCLRLSTTKPEYSMTEKDSAEEKNQENRNVENVGRPQTPRDDHPGGPKRRQSGEA